MSLGVVVKGAEGIVLAADSRVTLEARTAGAGHPLQINFDNATKLLSFSQPHNYVGVVTYGAAVIGLRTAHSFLPEFELTLGEERLTVEQYAQQLSGFYWEQWQKAMPQDYNGPSMTFIVGGYDPERAYGRAFIVNIPGQPEPVEQNPGETNFGMTWGGQLEIATRIIHGFDPRIPGILKQELGLDDEKLQRVLVAFRNLEFSIPYQVLPLQDCVDMANFLIRATMNAQDLGVGVRGVGGLVEVAVITRIKGLEYLQKKSLKVNDSRI